jgi:hypothetical protein
VENAPRAVISLGRAGFDHYGAFSVFFSTLFLGSSPLHARRPNKLTQGSSTSIVGGGAICPLRFCRNTKNNMSENKLYVGNLSFQTTDDSLAQLFSEFGTVGRASVVTDRETGRSRGFGFVEMSSDEEARSAISALHGQMVEGRNLTVNVARPREGGGGGGGRGGNRRDRY